MKINWRKINNILHRDVGYFFFGMTIIYALSGIALNHISDWDPNYIIENKKLQVDPSVLSNSMDKVQVQDLIADLDIDKGIKKHYYPSPGVLKVFLQGGSLTMNIGSGHGFLETVDRRPIFYEVNYLHYNHSKFLWTWFSDILCRGLDFAGHYRTFCAEGQKRIEAPRCLVCACRDCDSTGVFDALFVNRSIKVIRVETKWPL
jgi:hypothetical protein